jgi:hypothetical protein
MTNTTAKNGLAHIFESTDDAPAESVPPHTTGSEKAPSWFHSKDMQGVGEAMTTRYLARNSSDPSIVETPGPEAYDEFKRKLDDRFTQAQRLYDVPPPQVQRPTLPLNDIHGRRRLYQQEQRAHIAEQQETLRTPTPIFKMLGLGAIALLVGGGAGLAVLNYEGLSTQVSKSLNTVQTSLASFTIPQLALPKTNTETIIVKKSVAIASLEVNDVRGTLNSMIPLMLNAQVSDGANPVALKVMGLPPDSYLTKGIETTKGNWLLKPEDISGVQLVVPQFDAPTFDVEIAAIEEKTGILAAPVKEMTVEIDGARPQLVQVEQSDLAATIAPAAAPPDVSSQAAPIPAQIAANPEATALITKGDGLLNSGDLASARQFYLRANELGDANGAYGVGRTYDPKIFAELNVQGLQPDPDKATLWYKKAFAGGVLAARTALDTLRAAN